MISMSNIGSASGTSKYMAEQAAVEYYADQQSPAKWEGQGAEMQGLAGRAVTEKDLTDQLSGKVEVFNKETGEFEEKQLGRKKAEGEIEHRAGWDMTFAAPKSVSIESEVFANKDVREAHENAVSKAMQFLEDKAAQTRRSHGEFEKTGNLTYAKFEHATTREGDPQTHTHVIIANVTFDKDGKAMSVSNEKLMEYRTTADAVYKNELANNLEKLGYQTEWSKDGKNTSFEIKGYDKEGLDTFSKRSEQIKESLAERGLDKDTASHGARQAANLSTREDKNHSESAADHRDKWQSEASNAGVKEAERGTPQKGNETYAEQMQNAREAVASAVNHLSEREAAFNEKDLWKAAAQNAQGGTSTDKITDAIREQEKSGALIHREDGKYTTREAVEAEKTMGDKLSKGVGTHESVMSNKEFDKALEKFEERKGFALTDEQRGAARMILTGDDKFQGVQGLAGTGKTTMLEFVKEAAESKGWEVKGFSNGGAQADKMQQESGIKSTTTARHLIDSDKLQKDVNLAQRAIDTQEKNKGMFGKQPDFKQLSKDVDKGNAKLEFDSNKRAYITDKQGNTWTKDLYSKTTETTSKNLNHLGLTETKYISTEKGVFKSGGSIGSEVAGYLKDKVQEHTKDSGALGKAAGWGAEKVLTKGENWEKCGTLESAGARVQMAMDGASKRENAMHELKMQAAQGNGGNQKTLHVMDEASMSGQREFNRVIGAAEQQGAKTVFLGDEKQHQAVDAGKAFEVAQKSMTMSELGRDSIRRQTTDNAKESVGQILDGKYSEAVKGLETKQVSTNQDSVREKYNTIEKPTEKDTKEMRAEMKEASKEDNKLVIKELAKDYANLSPQQRDKTLVITSTNADRAAINREVRDNLKASGQLGDGKQVEIMSKSGLTKEEMTKAINFEKGQKVEFTKDARDQGFEKGMQGTVIGIDNKTNNVTVKMDDGRKLSFNPEKLEGKELYKASESKEFSKGDKIAFTKNDKDLNVKNGQTGTIEKMEGSKMTVKMENGEKRQFDTKNFKHIDHAYAMTSHKSQGQTFDKVMVHHNTNAGHGDRETYVNVTRAREDVKYYTQDSNKAAKQAGEKLDKESATGSSKSSSSSEKSSGNSTNSKSEAKESSSAKAMERDGGR